MIRARRGGAEVADWTLDRKIRVRFPAYPHRVWALWWQGGKRRLRTSRCPCRSRLGTLKTHSCPWRGSYGERTQKETLSKMRVGVENVSSISPACRKRRLKWGRFLGITVLKGWPCVDASTGTLKNPTKCLWR